MVDGVGRYRRSESRGVQIRGETGTGTKSKRNTCRRECCRLQVKTHAHESPTSHQRKLVASGTYTSWPGDLFIASWRSLFSLFLNYISTAGLLVVIGNEVPPTERMPWRERRSQ